MCQSPQISKEVGSREDKAHDNKHHPLDLEGEEGCEQETRLVMFRFEVSVHDRDHKKSHPDHGENDETEPENLNLSFRELNLVLS